MTHSHPTFKAMTFVTTSHTASLPSATKRRINLNEMANKKPVRKRKLFVLSDNFTAEIAFIN